MQYLKFICIVLLLFLTGSQSSASDFVIFSKTTKASIVYAPGKTSLDSIAANLLADDIQRVTGYRPAVSTSMANAKGNVILIGDLQSPIIKKFITSSSAQYKALNGQWERYTQTVLLRPTKNIAAMLLIAGSDRRGTAYGALDISQKIGVSPWYWWADVHPVKKSQLILSQTDFVSNSPSVKYRGIFLNDEDWGLQPWAAKTFEPETKDIGPKTYAKIFELLLRLKANLIWPAMHPSTKAFFYYPGNKKIADDYGIVIGSSHAEPMLRNNVDEWNEKTMGAFNYITNKESVYKYWEDRVKQNGKNEVAYTLGMRGVHDSAIEGVKTPQEAVPVIERIIGDQRELLRKYVNQDVTKVAQVFTAYKEVLEIYDLGLKLPEDVTIVWPDDNYGYIQRLNNEKENARSGGSGVYYHASYWGRPHDYLWLSSTHPALIREEMMKAYNTGAKNLWVLNVGDLKPLEYNIQLFMDMGWDAKPFQDNLYTKKHLLNWNNNVFGAAYAKPISNIMWNYYQLAFERRPEFMGWSQTEPTTQISNTAYNHFSLGDEAQKRIDKYDSLETAVKSLRQKIAPSRADAFYELVYYPVTGASLMNKKFLYRDKSMLYAKQNRTSALDYAEMSKQAYQKITEETRFYNENLAGGKWKYIMSMEPRKLPVYDMPAIPEPAITKTGSFDVVPEGYGIPASSATKLIYALPAFNKATARKYFVDIFLTNDQPVTWTASGSEPWIRLSQQTGTLNPVPGKKQVRIWASVDWAKAPKATDLTGLVNIKGAGKEMQIKVLALNPESALKGYAGFVENNGYVSIFASNVNRKSPQWNVLSAIGHTGNVLASPLKPVLAGAELKTPASVQEKLPVAEYHIFTFTEAKPEITFYSLPTQPLNNAFSMRFGASIDNGSMEVLDFKTVGRSETWKQNVLRNSAVSKVQLQALPKGKHTLRVYMIDPGVMIDRILVDLGGLPKAYSVIPETKVTTNKTAVNEQFYIKR